MTDHDLDHVRQHAHEPHTFVGPDSYGGCLVCGLGVAHQRHTTAFKRHDRVVVTEPYIAGWAMGQPGQPGGFPCLPGMIFTYWRPNITIRGAAVPGQPINHATLIAPGGSKLYNVPHHILRRATDDEIAAFNANVSKDPTATSEDPTPAHERSNEPEGAAAAAGGLKLAAELLTENAEQMKLAAELLERALVCIVASAASDDDAHRLARDIRRLLYGAPSNQRA